MPEPNRGICPECGSKMEGASLVCASCGYVIRSGDAAEESFETALNRVEETLAELKSGLYVGVFQSLKNQSHVVLPMFLLLMAAIGVFSPYDSEINVVVIPMFLLFLVLSIFAVRIRVRRKADERVEFAKTAQDAAVLVDRVRKRWGEEEDVRHLVSEYEQDLALCKKARRRDIVNAAQGYLIVLCIIAFVVVMVPWRDYDDKQRLREEAAEKELSPLNDLTFSVVPLRYRVNGMLSEYLDIVPGKTAIKHLANPWGVGVDMASSIGLLVKKRWSEPFPIETCYFRVELTVLDKNGFTFYQAPPFYLQNQDELPEALTRGSGIFGAKFHATLQALTGVRRQSLLNELLHRREDPTGFVISSRIIHKESSAPHPPLDTAASSPSTDEQGREQAAEKAASPPSTDEHGSESAVEKTVSLPSTDERGSQTAVEKAASSPSTDEHGSETEPGKVKE